VLVVMCRLICKEQIDNSTPTEVILVVQATDKFTDSTIVEVATGGVGK
jgi:hypothetical protein